MTPSLGGYKGVVDTLLVLSRPHPLLWKSPFNFYWRGGCGQPCVCLGTFPHSCHNRLDQGWTHNPSWSLPWTKEYNCQNQEELKGDPALVSTSELWQPEACKVQDLEKQTCSRRWPTELQGEAAARNSAERGEKPDDFLLLWEPDILPSVPCFCDIPHIWTIATCCWSCSLHCRNPWLQSKQIPRWIMRLE